MPRVPAALLFGLLVAGIVFGAPGSVRGAMATNEVTAAAEGHGVRCEGVANQDDGSSHLSCAREAADQSVVNIDISVTYNVLSADGESAFATAEPPRAPATWSAEGASTYEGFWTLTAYGNDSGSDRPQFAVGDSLPGTLSIDCTTMEGSCGMAATRDGDEWFVVSGEETGDGRIRMVLENQLDNCEGGQIHRSTYEAAFGPEKATATNESVTIPRTCTDDTGSLYFTDETWSFVGTITNYIPPPADDLAAFLASYGLTCADENATTTCTLPVTDEQGLDATYKVTTRMDEAGLVIGLDAVVISLDESLPSDATKFLREVAVRAPIADRDALLAWFDSALAGSATPYEGGGWTASWADFPEGAGRTLALAVTQVGVGPSPRPTEAAAPGSSRPPSAAPSAPVAPVAPPAPVDERLAGSRPFADSIPKPAEISTDPIVLLQSAGLAALLVFLMPFPSQLFNSTLESHEDEVRRWLRLDRVGSAVAGIGAFWASRPGVIAFTLLAAVLYGFLDPGFGPDLGSLATFMGMLLGIVLVTAAFAVPTVLAHRRIGDRWSLKVVPVSLLIGVACVVLSRLTGFQPGYLYGLLIGLAFARELSAADEGRATAFGAAIMLIVAFGAWLALGALPDGEAFGLVVARTSLAALMVAGLEGVVFGLLPMRFLPGEPLYAWNRILWGGLLLVGAFAFFHILINPASGYLSDTSRTPLLTVVGLLLGFSLVSIAFWGWFRFRTEPEEVAGPSQ